MIPFLNFIGNNLSYNLVYSKLILSEDKTKSNFNNQKKSIQKFDEKHDTKCLDDLDQFNEEILPYFDGRTCDYVALNSP